MALREVYETTFDEDVLPTTDCSDCGANVRTSGCETICKDCGLVLESDRLDQISRTTKGLIEVLENSPSCNFVNQQTAEFSPVRWLSFSAPAEGRKRILTSV